MATLSSVPAKGAAFATQTRADFDANWDLQIGCPDQADPKAREAVWADMGAGSTSSSLSNLVGLE